MPMSKVVLRTATDYSNYRGFCILESRNPYFPMKILVTGGSGFIGSQIALSLQNEHDVTIVDRTICRENLAGFQGEIMEADVSDGGFWSALNDTYDSVSHQAACTDTTVMDADFMDRENRGASMHMLDWAFRSEADIVYASSAAVYGAAKSPQTLGVGEAPLNCYGESKLAFDQHVRTLLPETPIKIIGLRYFNVYGPHETHKEHMASMIYQLAQQMLQGKNPRIFEFGEQERDQIYVQDIVSLNEAALEAPQEASGIYNAGTGNSVSFNRIIEALNSVLGTSLEPEYFENPYDFYQDNTCADMTETMEKLAWKPQYDIDVGVREYSASGWLTNAHG